MATKIKEKVNGFREAHPTASKAIKYGGIAVAGAAVGAGAVILYQHVAGDGGGTGVETKVGADGTSASCYGGGCVF